MISKRMANWTKVGSSLLLLGLIAVPVPVGAAIMNGNALHELCERNEVECGFVVIGLFDMLYFIDEDRRECFPEPLAVRQIHDVFVKFLEDNPAQRSFTAASLFNLAMREAWPCD